MRYFLRFLTDVDLRQSHNCSTDSNGDRLTNASISPPLRIKEVWKAILLSTTFLLCSLVSVSLSAAGEPAIPTPFEASDGEFSDMVRLTWPDVAGETHYQIFRCEPIEGGACGDAIVTPENAIHYDDIEADSIGGVIYYRLQACNDIGCSNFSADTGYTNVIFGSGFEPDTATITSFTVNGTISVVLPLGGSVSLDWSTLNADTCEASSSLNLDDWNPTTTIGTYGPKTVELPASNESYSLDLSCKKADGPVVSRQVTVTVTTVPEAPTLEVATPGDGSVELSFTDNDNGGSPITGYTASCDLEVKTGSSSPITVDGLTNGTQYSCSVIATNDVGNSGSSNVKLVIPVTKPEAPTLEVATPGDGSAVLSFTDNGNGGSPITGYTASCDLEVKTGSSSPITVDGLTNGTQYSCSVIATNDVDNSESSNVKLVIPVTKPEAPTLVDVAPGDGSAVLSFTDNGNGGSAITGYTATCSTPDSENPLEPPLLITQDGTSSPITVGGLTNDIQYSCSVIASNDVGNSGSSNVELVTPVAPVSIIDFKVTTAKDPQPVSCGDVKITYTWQSENAHTCYGSWEKSESNPTGLLASVNGTMTNVFQDLAGDEMFTLRCANDQGDVSEPRTVTVTANVPCLTTRIKSWSELFYVDWPGPKSITTSRIISSGTNLAIQFNTGPVLRRTAASSPITMNKMRNGVQYSCSVIATNAIGSSAPSNLLFVTPLPLSTTNVVGDSTSSNILSVTTVATTTVPDAPTLDSLAAGDGSAELSFTPNGDGGSAITGYTASCNISTLGGVGTSEFGGTHAVKLLAISELPGDYRVADECKTYQYREGWLVWETEGSERAPSACHLKADTTYYWNITLSDGINADSSTCTNPYCQTWLHITNPSYVN